MAILQLYKNSCQSYKKDIILYKIQNRENIKMYNKCALYFYIKFILSHSYGNTVKNLDLKVICSNHILFLYCLEQVLEEFDLLRACKMFEYARKKNFYSKKLCDLKTRCKKLYRYANKT